MSEDLAGPVDVGGPVAEVAELSEGVEFDGRAAVELPVAEQNGESVDQLGPLRFAYDKEYLPTFDLGWAPSRLYPPELEEFSDEIAVVLDSVLVRDGVVRGLLQNRSKTLFARGVVVSVGGMRWEFPLTVQPTEAVPFVIEGYGGITDPASIGFEIIAEFVSHPDPKRSLLVTETPGNWAAPWGDLQVAVPNYNNEEPPEGTSDDDWVYYYETLVELRMPDSHPSIADMALTQTIENLKIYVTKTDDDGRVLDVRELVPYVEVQVGVSDDGWPLWGHSPIDRLPFDDGQDINRSFLVGFIPDTHSFMLTVGGAHDDGSR